MKKFFYLIAASLLTSFLLISCSSGVTETKEVSFTIPNAFADVVESRIASRSASQIETKDYSLKIQLNANGSVQEQTAPLNADKSNVNVTFSNVVVGSSATLKVWLLYKNDEVIATGTSDTFVVKDGQNAVKITLKFEEGKGFPKTNDDTFIYFYSNDGYSYKKGSNTVLTGSTDKFAFDKEGNLYALKGNENVGLSIITDKQGSQNTDYSIISGESLSGGYGITIDQETDTLYTYICKPASDGQLVDFSNSPLANLYKYSGFINNPVNNPTSTNYEINYDTEVKSQISFDPTYFRFKHCAMTVNNNVLYDLIIDESKRLYLIKSDIGETSLTNSTVLGKDYTSGYTPDNFNGKSDAIKYLNISDMVYIDGYIYVLFNDAVIDTMYETSSPYVAYHGCIIKIDSSTGNKTELGWSGNTDTVSVDVTSDTEKFVVYTKPESIYRPGYEDEPHTKYATITGADAEAKKTNNGNPFVGSPWTFRVPQYSSNPTASTYNFYSPHKFLAVKPKKLVVSDSGIAFYTTADGVWAYKNINRIVTINIDLGQFLIESVKDAGVNFTQKQTDHYVFDGSGMRAELDDNYGVNGWFLRAEPDTWDHSGSEYSRWLGIPNID